MNVIQIQGLLVCSRSKSKKLQEASDWLIKGDRDDAKKEMICRVKILEVEVLRRTRSNLAYASRAYECISQELVAEDRQRGPSQTLGRQEKGAAQLYTGEPLKLAQERGMRQSGWQIPQRSSSVA